jgi:hypothetical protein
MFVLLIAIGLLLFGLWFLVGLNSFGGSQTQQQKLPDSNLRGLIVISLIYLALAVGWLAMSLISD